MRNCILKKRKPISNPEVRIAGKDPTRCSHCNEVLGEERLNAGSIQWIGFCSVKHRQAWNYDRERPNRDGRDRERQKIREVLK